MKKVLLTSIIFSLLSSTSAFAAEPKFLFRYASGAVSYAPTTPEPETPETPETPAETEGKLEYLGGGRIRAEPLDNGGVEVTTTAFKYVNKGKPMSASIVMNIGNGFQYPICTNVHSWETNIEYTCDSRSFTLIPQHYEQFKDYDLGYAFLKANFFANDNLVNSRPDITLPLPIEPEQEEDFDINKHITFENLTMTWIDRNNNNVMDIGDFIEYSVDVVNTHSYSFNTSYEFIVSPNTVAELGTQIINGNGVTKISRTSMLMNKFAFDKFNFPSKTYHTVNGIFKMNASTFGAKSEMLPSISFYVN